MADIVILRIILGFARRRQHLWTIAYYRDFSKVLMEQITEKREASIFGNTKYSKHRQMCASITVFPSTVVICIIRFYD